MTTLRERANRRRFFGLAGLAAVCLPLAVAPTARASEVTGYAVLTSDYVVRGVSYSDSHPTAQAGIDASLNSGLYLGVWGSAVDIHIGQTRRDAEVNYYLGYEYDLNADWTVGANVVANTYPGTAGPIDYDYREYSAVANFRDHAWVEYSYSPDLFNTSRHTHNIEAYAEWPATRNLLVGLGAGYYDVSSVSGAGYGYWQVGITRPFDHFSVDLRYHDTNRYVLFVSSPGRADARVVLSLRMPFTLAGD
ncbi:MAG TPA: TorF family putative porin [Woeseiaceae bacterium]|nr:TorF family putative porin [Woeseiaceae bacterium]